MKENHQEIARQLAAKCNIGYAKDDRNAITAAVDVAYERGVWDSAEAGVAYVRRLTTFQDYSACGLADAILALLAPPVPVWEHKPDCPTPYQWHSGSKVWFFHTPLEDCCPTQRATHCDGCGAPKPVTKGS